MSKPTIWPNPIVYPGITSIVPKSQRLSLMRTLMAENKCEEGEEDPDGWLGKSGYLVR